MQGNPQLPTQQDAPLVAVLDYLHAKARRRSEVIGIPPLTLYLHLTSTNADESVVLPDRPVLEDVSALLPQVNDYFTHRRRMPRVQFFDRQCPRLEADLKQGGYVLDEKLPLLTCTPAQLQMPPTPTHLKFTVLTADSDAEALAAGWMLNDEGFSGKKSRPSEQEVANFRQMLVHGRAFSAHVEGVGVAAGMFNEPMCNVAELVGITTLRPFRRRGVATALTAAITGLAFELGAHVAFLVAASAEASRIYLRLGYQFSTHLVTMSYLTTTDVPF